MPSQHAVLSPSAAERWIECPASIGMERSLLSIGVQDASSVYAEEGTCAHALAELKASLAFEKITARQYTIRLKKWQDEWAVFTQDDMKVVEMHEHTDAYVALLKERMALYPHSILFLEQRLDTGVPSCWGTSDAVIVSPVHVEIVDFKYGAGVAVEAHGNPQLRLYACGALDEHGDVLGETELVRITVHQPRMDHVLTDEMTPQALRDWRTSIFPVAEEALSDNAHFSPTDEACRWCPASGRCRAQLEAVFATDFEGAPDVLTPEEMSKTLPLTKMVRDWLNAFEEAALDMAYSKGTPIPGYKVVLSGGQRAVRDAARALDALLDAGYANTEVVNVKIKGIGDLEKMLGAPRFRTLLEDTGIVTKSEGKPALVPESDKRPAVAPNSEAAKEFAREDLLS